MTSIPDSFNVNDLTELLATAKHEDEIHAENNGEKDFEPEAIWEMAQNLVAEATNKCPSPIVHKAMIVVILKKMIDWHTSMGAMMFENDDNGSGVCWLRDAGKFQAMWDTLHQISLGEDDFLCDHND